MIIMFINKIGTTIICILFADTQNLIYINTNVVVYEFTNNKIKKKSIILRYVHTRTTNINIKILFQKQFDKVHRIFIYNNLHHNISHIVIVKFC